MFKSESRECLTLFTLLLQLLHLIITDSDLELAENKKSSRITCCLLQVGLLLCEN